MIRQISVSRQSASPKQAGKQMFGLTGESSSSTQANPVGQTSALPQVCTQKVTSPSSPMQSLPVPQTSAGRPGAAQSSKLHTPLGAETSPTASIRQAPRPNGEKQSASLSHAPPMLFSVTAL